ncbi:MAG: hypothetical protein ACPIOQ_04860, partial [Promethearchaeia archaeon]
MQNVEYVWLAVLRTAFFLACTRIQHHAHAPRPRWRTPTHQRATQVEKKTGSKFRLQIQAGSFRDSEIVVMLGENGASMPCVSEEKGFCVGVDVSLCMCMYACVYSHKHACTCTIYTHVFGPVFCVFLTASPWLYTSMHTDKQTWIPT